MIPVVIGLDPGYAAMGASVLEPQQHPRFPLAFSFALLQQLTWRTKPTGLRQMIDLSKRVDAQAGQLLQLLEGIGPANVAAIAIEQAITPMAKRGPGGKARVDVTVISGLGQVRGAVTGIARALKIRIVDVDPQAVKAATTGARDAKKGTVQKAVALALGWNAEWPGSEHSADACAVGMAATRCDRQLAEQLRAAVRPPAKCPRCVAFFAVRGCTAATCGECDCPRCQGTCQCERRSGVRG